MEPTVFPQLAHLKIPLEEIREATNNFADKNIIGKGGFGNVYKGKLTRFGKSKKIVARRLGRNQWQGEVEFWTEISMLSTLESNYLVSLVGYCDEKGEKIIINRHYPKGSLVTYLSDPITLDWDKRLSIAYLLAEALSFIHDKLDMSYYVIHRNINSSTIVLESLDRPKLSGFEHSIKRSVDRKNQIFRCAAIGSQGYMDPATEASGGVTHKSDIYSLGVVLFELLCGRKANENNTLLGPLAKFHYENGTLQEIIHPYLWKQMKPHSFKCFSEAAYSCLQDDQTHRPDAYPLFEKLAKASFLQSVVDYVADEVEESQETDIPSDIKRLLEELPPPDITNMEHWRIEIRDLFLALEYLKNASLQFLGGHSDYMWIVKLKCLNREHLRFLKAMNKDELVKKHYPVMIKMIDVERYRVIYGQEYLSTEREILSSCNHENIESFLGFCDMDYIYISSQSLFLLVIYLFI